MPGSSQAPGKRTTIALRVILAFSAALTLANLLGLHATYLAPLAAASLALGGRATLLKALAVPLVFWMLVWLVALLTEIWAEQAPLAYALAILGGLYVGYRLCLRGGAVGSVGYVSLIAFAETPMRFMAEPALTATVANDLGLVALVGALCAWLAGLFLPGVIKPSTSELQPPLAPLAAALITLLGAWLVWALTPPAPGAIILSIILVLRANPYSGAVIAKHRFWGTLAGGIAALLASMVAQYSQGALILFLALLAVGWPMAWAMTRDDVWQDFATKSLNALGIMLGQGLSPLFGSDAPGLLGPRVVGVMIGIAFALLAWALLSGPQRGHKNRPSGGRSAVRGAE